MKINFLMRCGMMVTIPMTEEEWGFFHKVYNNWLTDNLHEQSTFNSLEPKFYVRLDQIDMIKVLDEKSV